MKSKKSPAIEEYKSKIGGYDGYEVRDAVRTLRKAQEIKNDAAFLKVVLIEMDKEAAKTEETADLIKRTSSKLRGLFNGKHSEKSKA